MRSCLLAAILVLSACGSNADDDDDDDDNSSANDDDTAADDDDDVVEAYSVSGNVTDSEGNPYDRIALILCRAGSCLNATTNENGSFTFLDVPSGHRVIRNINSPSPTGGGKHAILDYSELYDIVPIDNAALDIGRVVPPAMSEWVFAEDLGSDDTATFFAGTASELTVSWSSPLDFPSATADVPDDEMTLGAGVIPEEYWPKAMDGKIPLAAFGLSPWETSLEGEGADFTFTWSLPEGADTSLSYGFLFADYEFALTDGQFRYAAAKLDPGTNTISASFPQLTMVVPVHD